MAAHKCAFASEWRAVSCQSSRASTAALHTPIRCGWVEAGADWSHKKLVLYESIKRLLSRECNRQQLTDIIDR